MADEFDPIHEPVFSSFWPLLISILGLIIYFAVQDYYLNRQGAVLNQQLQQASPTISEAQNVSTRYVALMNDLLKTAQKDDNAMAIVNDCKKAGLIREVNTNAASATPPAKE
jgi:hypothetical protein